MVWAAWVLCFAVAVVLAGVEAALLAVSRVRARHAADEGDAKAARLVTLLEQRGELLQAAVTANHALSITAFLLLVWGLEPSCGMWSLGLAMAIVLPLYLVGLELLPKSFFRRFPFRSLRRLTWLLSILRVAYLPWRLVSRHFRWMPEATDRSASGGVSALADIISSMRLLPTLAVGLLQSFAKFERTTASQLMTSLLDVTGLPADLPLSTAIPLVARSPHGHLPVLNDRGEVIGFFDLARVTPQASPDRLVRLFTQPLIRVRADQPALQCLQTLRRAGTPLALVMQSSGAEKPVGLLHLEVLLDAVLTAAPVVESRKNAIARSSGSMTTLPAPRNQLGGCIWLPRIIAKARLLLANQLPPDYVARFCAANGTDGQFIQFFGLSREDLMAVAVKNDEQVARWFQALPTVSPEKIAEWNHIAENLGRPGFPMADRLPVAKATVYQHLDTSSIDTIFGLIDLDERAC